MYCSIFPKTIFDDKEVFSSDAFSLPVFGNGYLNGSAKGENQKN